MGAQESCTAVFRTDTVGKVFKVFVNGTFRCLVCERLFSSDASREHCAVPCVPAVPAPWLLKNSSVLILPLSTGA
jgi:hypothetical protein